MEKILFYSRNNIFSFLYPKLYTIINMHLAVHKIRQTNKIDFFVFFQSLEK